MGAKTTARTCPRCDSTLSAKEKQGEAGAMLVWQCPCGWACVRTVPLSEDAPPLAASRAGRSISGVTPRVHIELGTEGQRRRG